MAFKIIISDLHLGAGLEGAGGNTLEDFTSDVEFVEWINGLIAESNARGEDVELVINGDFLEMVQVPAVARFDPRATYPPERYAANDQASAELKLTHITQGHPGVFAALADFVNPDGPRRNLVILKGNHDPEWYWPGVQSSLRRIVGATGDLESLLLFPDTHYVRDGVYVEHGNQYTETVNRFSDPAAPLDPHDPSRLELIWGSRFVIDYFNQIERERPWVDGVKPLTALIWYGFQFDFPFALRALIALIRAAPRLLLARNVERVEFDAADTLVAEWSAADPAGNLETRYAADPEFRRDFHGRIIEALAAAGVDADLIPATREAMPAEPRQLAAQITEHYRAQLRTQAQRIARETGATVISFGHSHHPELTPLDDGAVYVNSGCWIWLGDFSSATAQEWQELIAHPERYMNARRLSYVRVDFDAAGRPQALLLEAGNPPVEPPPDNGDPSNGSTPPEARRGCLANLLPFLFRA